MKLIKTNATDFFYGNLAKGFSSIKLLIKLCQLFIYKRIKTSRLGSQPAMLIET